VSELPYTCEGCRGARVIPAVRIGARVARPERPCSECDGAGRLSQDSAIALTAVDSVPSARHGVMLGEPRYVAQARAIGDVRVLALYDRLVAIVARRERERSVRDA
jgi:hypothetical protein